MRADKTYVYQGKIYLRGAEMPKGWKPPAGRGVLGSLDVIGPEGKLTELPAPPGPVSGDSGEQSEEPLLDDKKE